MKKIFLALLLMFFTLSQVYAFNPLIVCGGVPEEAAGGSCDTANEGDLTASENTTYLLGSATNMLYLSGAFVKSGTSAPCRVDLILEREDPADAVTVTGNVYVGFFPTPTGAEDYPEGGGTLLNSDWSDAVDVTTITTTDGGETITFENIDPGSMTGSDNYCFVLKSDTEWDSVNGIKVSVTLLYANPDATYKDTDGLGFSSHSSTNNMIYRIYE